MSEATETEEKIYFINLDSSVERCNDLIAEFDGALPDNFRLVRWNAVRHPEGWKGCLLSHATVLSHAKEHNDRTNGIYIVLEDDCSLLDSKIVFKERFAKYYDYLRSHHGEWDVFSGGGIYVTPRRIVCRDPFIIECAWIVSSHFLIHSDKSADTVIQYGAEPEKWKRTIDSYIAAQHSGKLWVAYPFLCDQNFEYESTIGKTARYTDILRPLFQKAMNTLDEFVRRNSV
jgi:hypothetical protein